MCNETTIRQLVRRFMDGQTTLEEERLMGEWFACRKQVPADLEPYRQMFAYFEQGMPLGAFQSADTLQPSVRGMKGQPRHPMKFRHWLLPLAAACGLVAVVMVLWPMSESAEGNVASVSVVTQQPVQIDTTRMVDSQNRVSPDSTTRMRPKPRPAHRSAPIYRPSLYSPQPTKPLMACADEVMMVDSLPSMVEAFVAQNVLQAQMEDQLLFEQVMQVGAKYENQALGVVLAELTPDEVY